MEILNNGVLFSNILPFFAETLQSFYGFLTTPLRTILSEMSIVFAVIAKIVEKIDGVEWLNQLLDMQFGILLFGAGLTTVLVVNLIKWFIPIV